MAVAEGDGLKEAEELLKDSKIEIFRREGGRLALAERVRFHLMEAGVFVESTADACYRVSYLGRIHRSSFAAESDEERLQRVRAQLQGPAAARGYAEVGTGQEVLRNPMDEKEILDVCLQITYAREGVPLADLAAELRWALALPKFLDGEGAR